MRRFSLILLRLACVLCFDAVLANWTASGTFHYMDREFDQSGFTGVESAVPVRFADIEIIDANAAPSKMVIASGSTDAFGGFILAVQDSKVRDVYARVVTRAQNTADLNVDVKTGTSQQASFYAAASNTVAGHNPAVNVNFGTLTIAIGLGGEPFNIFDQMVTGTDYVAFLTGSRPAAHLRTIWGPANGVTDAFYSSSNASIILRDSAGYDDTVVLHEMGHFIIQEYSNTDNPGGAHTFAWCDIDLRTAFDEGWATFWGNSALRHQGRPRCNVYTRTNGGPGIGNLVRSADLENDTQYLCVGATSEVSVFTVLWDIVDGASTLDLTAGTDDSHDMMDLDDTEVWEVMTGYLPGATNVTLEDFWDGWFLPPILNGYHAEMMDIAGHVGIEYAEDLLEENDTVAGATPAPPGFPAVHSTFFRDPDLDGAGGPDEDYFSFETEGGETYIIETLNLSSDANTKLYLIDSDGSTVLAINDNRGPSDESSLIEWTAPRTDTFFTRVFHAPDWGIYGSYDFKVHPLNATDGDTDGYIASVDCDDGNPDVNPGMPESCNGLDDNCNGIIDEGFDADLDGYSICAGDCLDSNPAVHPGLSEIPGNGLDDNCNGIIDEGVGGSRELEHPTYRRAGSDS